MEHGHNQTSFEDAEVSKHDRSAVAPVSVEAGAGCETMPIPPDCERIPGSDVIAGATDAGWETMSISPDRAHIPGDGVAAGTPGPNRETMPIPSDYERVPGTNGDAGDPSFVRFYFDDDI